MTCGKVGVMPGADSPLRPPNLRGWTFLRVSLLAALWGAACVLDPEFIGATLTTTATITASETGATVPTTGDEGASATSSAPSEGAYGVPCELVGVELALLDTWVTLQPACDDGICALVQDELRVCQTDEQCTQDDPGSACSFGTFCELSPAFIAANSRCTRTCEVVDDCPAMQGCKAGVTCSVLTLSGDLCCQKMCVCLDHLNPVLQAANQTTCNNEPEPCP